MKKKKSAVLAAGLTVIALIAAGFWICMDTESGVLVDRAEFDREHGFDEDGTGAAEGVLLKVPKGEKTPAYYDLDGTLEELNEKYGQKLALGDAVRVVCRSAKNFWGLTPGVDMIPDQMDVVWLWETEKTAEMDFAEFYEAREKKEIQEEALNVYNILTEQMYHSDSYHPAKDCFAGLAVDEAQVTLSLTDAGDEIVRYYRDLVEQEGGSFDCVVIQEAEYSWQELYEMRERAVERLSEDYRIVTHFTDERQNMIEIVIAEKEAPDPKKYFAGCEGIDPERIRITCGEMLPKE